MDYLIIGLLVLLIILVIFSISKNINESNITERLGKLETTLVKELAEFKNNINVNLNSDFDKLDEKIERKLNMINDHVNERLDVNFE